MEKRIVSALQFLLIATAATIPLFFFKYSVFPEVFPKMLYAQILIEALFFLWVPLAVAFPRYRPKLNFVTGALGIFIAVLLVSAAAGFDFSKSFWSTQERAVGVFALLHLAVFPVVLISVASEKLWKKLMWATVTAGWIISVIALIQLKIRDFLLTGEGAIRPGSTFGNPNFMAAYLLFAIFIGAYLAFGDRNRRRVSRAVAAAAILTTAAALVASQTRGAFVGFACGTVFLFVLALFTAASRRVRAAAAAALVLILIFGGVFITTRQSSVWKGNRLLDRLRNISPFSAEYVPRVAALSAAWRGFLEHPVLGWGWDNFNIVFNKYYDPSLLTLGYQETRFDKPHNVIMEYLISGGVALLAAYLVLFAAVFRVLLKRRSENERRGAAPYLAAALVAYFVQDLFLFDTVSSFLMFFFICAWAAYTPAPSVAIPGEIPAVSARGRRRMFWVSVSVGILLAFWVNVRPMEAAYYQYWGFLEFKKDPVRGMSDFRKAMALAGLYRWTVARDYATVMANAYFYNPGALAPADVEEAVRLMEQVTAEHSWDAYNHYTLADLYNQISDINPQLYLPKAEREEQSVLSTLSPNRQETLYSLAKTKSLEGNNAAALSIMEKAVGLNPDIQDSQFYYGLLLFSAGDFSAGYEHVQKAQALGRQWRNNDEARVVANYYADGGHFPEAIALYQKALSLEPNDLEARAKLGIAYYIAGDKERAAQEIRIVMGKTDLSQSPAYASLKPILKDLHLAP